MQAFSVLIQKICQPINVFQQAHRGFLSLCYLFNQGAKMYTKHRVKKISISQFLHFTSHSELWRTQLKSDLLNVGWTWTTWDKNLNAINFKAMNKGTARLNVGSRLRFNRPNLKSKMITSQRLLQGWHNVVNLKQYFSWPDQPSSGLDATEL